jgi:hypothetical protein
MDLTIAWAKHGNFRGSFRPRLEYENRTGNSQNNSGPTFFLENKALYRLFKHKYIFPNEKILNYEVVARRDLQFSYKTFFHPNSYEIIMIFFEM